MKNRILIGIFFFLFLLTASGVFAAMVGNSRQGSLAISVTSQPGSAENAAETYQGLTCIILNPVSVGAFISKDPIGFAADINFYRYAANDPMLFTDPLGLYWVKNWLWYDHTDGFVLSVYGVPWFSWPPTMGSKLIFRTQVSLTDFYYYQKIWVPEPPCYEIYPSVSGIAERYTNTVTDYWPVAKPVPSGFSSYPSSEKATDFRGYFEFSIP